MIQIALADGIGHIAQPFDRIDNLTCHPSRQLQTDEDGQQDSQDSQDIKGDFQNILRRQVDVLVFRITRYGAGNGQMDVRMRRNIVKAQAFASPVEVRMTLAMAGHDLLAQVHLVDASRIVKVFLIAPNRHIEALVFQMVRSLEETAHVAMILVGPDAEAAQLELDGHVLPALWPDEGNDIGSIDIAELQGQKDGHTDDSRKQDRNENHDEVGKKETLAQRPVPEFHNTHLIFLSLLYFTLYY